MSNPNFAYIDTELSAVNTILGSIGQGPYQELDKENPEIFLAFNLLQDALIDVLNEGWTFNREENITQQPDVNTGWIEVPYNALRFDISKGQSVKTTDVVVRNGRLWDKIAHTDVFTEDVDVDIVWLFGFDQDTADDASSGQSIPQVFKRYIVAKACTRAALSMLTNMNLAEAYIAQETLNRAACQEYETDQGDYSWLGTPNNTVYSSYQPYQALARS